MMLVVDSTFVEDEYEYADENDSHIAGLTSLVHLAKITLAQKGPS